MSNNPLYGFPIGPWIRSFAWFRVWTYDAGYVWLVPVYKRHIQKHAFLGGGSEHWWQYRRFK